MNLNPFSWIASALVKIGGSTIVNIFLKPIFDFIIKSKDIDLEKFKAKVGVERDVLVTALGAEVKANKDNRNFYAGMKATQWLIVIALLPPILHSGAIFLDSTFCNDKLHQCMRIGEMLGMPWRVPPAPPPYDDREWLMISTLLGVQTMLAGAMGWLRYLRSK